DPAAVCGKHSQDVALRAVIDCDDMMSGKPLAAVAVLAVPHRLVPFVGLSASDFFRQIHSLETRPIEGLGLQGCDIDVTLRIVRNGAARWSVVADAPGQPASIHPRKADQPILFQPNIKRLRGAVVCRRSNRGAQNEPARGRGCGLNVLPICPDIPDMREGESDDLASVGRICQDLLIAGDRGVEANLADSSSLCAKASAPKYGPIRKDKRGIAVGRSRCRIAHYRGPVGNRNWPGLQVAAGS